MPSQKKAKRSLPECPHYLWHQEKYATQQSNAPALDAKGKRCIQQVRGEVLFGGRAVDSMPLCLCLVSAIASQFAKPTEDTLKQTQ